MSNWISVKDRVPENEFDVLIVTRTKTGSRSINKGYYLVDSNRFVHQGTAEVTHWMPLPEFPAEE